MITPTSGVPYGGILLTAAVTLQGVVLTRPSPCLFGAPYAGTVAR
ncbi:MAG: hypothetical protein WBF79_06255 [Rhodococcus sp. (in: high G+C Gram-positive bacteria)]